MAFIAVSGEPGCGHDALAAALAKKLGWELITESSLDESVAAQLPEPGRAPGRAWPYAAISILASLAHPHMVVCCAGGEALIRGLPGTFSLHLVAPESVRLKKLVEQLGLSREQAKLRLRKLALAQAETRKRRFGEKVAPATAFDLIVNVASVTQDQAVEFVEAAVRWRGITDSPSLSPSETAEIQFRARLQLARYGIVPPNRAEAERKTFGHPSEEVFANLLDLYRIAWDYEPRSFPLQWDKDGKVCEAFTPDFYLPEFDLYVELTTMKQANVTRKNRKIRLLRAIYPHVNIQIFYQKDVQELVMRRRLPQSLIR
jgi:cytidylate kinase